MKAEMSHKNPPLRGTKIGVVTWVKIEIDFYKTAVDIKITKVKKKSCKPKCKTLKQWIPQLR